MRPETAIFKIPACVGRRNMIYLPRFAPNGRDDRLPARGCANESSTELRLGRVARKRWKLDLKGAQKKHCLRAVSPPSVYLSWAHPTRLLRSIGGGAMFPRAEFEIWEGRAPS